MPTAQDAAVELNDVSPSVLIALTSAPRSTSKPLLWGDRMRSHAGLCVLIRWRRSAWLVARSRIERRTVAPFGSSSFKRALMRDKSPSSATATKEWRLDSFPPFSYSDATGGESGFRFQSGIPLAISSIILWRRVRMNSRTGSRSMRRNCLRGICGTTNASIRSVSFSNASTSQC